MLPEDIISELEVILSQREKGNIGIRSSRPVSGGCINQAFEVVTDKGNNYFVKYNLETLYPGMFHAEAKGLGLLHRSYAVNVPAVISSGQAGQYGFLLLEFVSAGRVSDSFFKNLGSSLARLHKTTQKSFGLDHSNYIGSLQQPNSMRMVFADFFTDMRLSPLVKKARDNKLLDSGIEKCFDRLYNRLSEIIPAEPPSLLHGDLWNGNRIIGPDGEAWLIDPAVYFGHRESDIAMTLLFGGFDRDFYNAYNEAHPLIPGWKNRADILNLYPLLVHLNLFGKGYLPQIAQVVSRY